MQNFHFQRFLQTANFQRFLPCVESQLAKHCFSAKFGGNVFTKRSVGKIFLPNFVHALLDKYYLKPVAKNDDLDERAFLSVWFRASVKKACAARIMLAVVFIHFCL